MFFSFFRSLGGSAIVSSSPMCVAVKEKNVGKRKKAVKPTLKSLDDKGGGGGDDGDRGLSVLDGELTGDSETLPVLGGLGNVFSDLLGGLLGGTGEVSKRE
jgi:hypothetical protein